MLRTTDFSENLLKAVSFLLAPNRSKETLKIKKIQWKSGNGFLVDNYNIQRDWMKIWDFIQSESGKIKDE